MNAASSAEPRNVWSRMVIALGSLAMLMGAVDPLEGSVVILPGSGLVALGAFLGHSERRLIAYRVGVFALIFMGVGTMWALGRVGGFGGPSGRSMWWGLLVLPYLIGWSMGIWGPKSPRWVLLLGIVVGLWYLALMWMVLHHPRGGHGAATMMPGIVIGITGLLTIIGCITALLGRSAGRNVVGQTNG